MKRSILRDCAHLVDKIEVVYQCEFDAAVRTPGTPQHQFFNSSPQLAKSKVLPKMVIRDGLRGGCVELYSLSAEADEDHEVCYYDINRYVKFHYQQQQQ